MKKIQTFLKDNWLILTILFVASCLRLIALGVYPRGTYTDEAYGAYIAYGLLTAGMDDRGCHFPVYFIAWGSGMNALYSYLGMLFFRLFGVSLLIYRLPQALLGILSIAAFYILCRELFGRKEALFFAFVLAVNPWHIMMCRFGLESSLAPGMFVIGLTFFVLGLLRKSTYLVLAAIFWGLTLYCYAMTWLVLPLFLLLAVIFCGRWIPVKKVTVFSVVILFILALPLLLFVMINLGLLSEIRTSFFTIPRLTGFRGGELSLAHIKEGLRDFYQILIVNQGDSKALLSPKPTGAYYYFTTPFMIYGIIHHVYVMIKHYRRGKNDLSVLLLIWLVSAGTVGVINLNLTMIHLAMIHIPVIFYGAYGIYQFAKIIKSKWFLRACMAFYTVSLTFFGEWYVHQEFSFFSDERPREAVARAKEIAGKDGTVTIFSSSIYKFPNLLWNEKFDIKDYVENAATNEDPYFIELLEYKDYRYIVDASVNNVSPDGVYVIHENRIGDFVALGFQVEKINDTYAVAAMHIPPQ